MGFPGKSFGKDSSSITGDPSSIPGLRRCPTAGKSYPVKYSGLENSTDRVVNRVPKRWT